MTPRKAWLIGSAAVAAALYVLMWTGFASHCNWLNATDSASLKTLHIYAAAHPGWVNAWNVFCTIFGPTGFRLFALVAIVVALTRRNVRGAIFLLISVEPSGLLTEIAKGAANRPRPETALAVAPSTSFPSGHAVSAMVGVLALLTVALPVVRRPLRAWLIAGGAVIVVAVGVGRVVLNVHYPSDVLAGWALGYVYFVVCLLMVRPRRPATAADEPAATPGIAA